MEQWGGNGVDWRREGSLLCVDGGLGTIWVSSLVRTVQGRGPHEQAWGARDLWVKPLADLRAGQARSGRPSRCQEQSGRGRLEKARASSPCGLR